MTKRMTDKIALITGAGGGKGLALAKLLQQEGAFIVLTDIDREGGQSNAEAIGSSCDFLNLDVTKEDDWKAVIAHIQSRHGRLNLLVNSARIHTRNPDLAATALDEWKDQIAVNLDGAFLGMKHALPLMRTSNGASIVNVISLSAVAPFAPTPAYSASHAALLNLTKTTAVNCARAKEDVRVNAVVCGMSSNSPVSAITEIAQRLVPLGRPAYAEDIAEAIVWLASDNSRYVTGTSVTLDGGYTAEGLPGA